MKDPVATLAQLLSITEPLWPAASRQQALAYYQLVLKWNPRLHLTTLTRPEEFMDRHLREPLFAAPFLLPEVTSLWDLGSGLGVPGLPLSLLRPDLDVTLVEASTSKAVFLETVIHDLALTRTRVVSQRFQELPPLPPGSAITVRAIERMDAILPEILKFGENAAQILFFCSAAFADRLVRPLLHPIPGSNDRWLAALKCST